MEDKEGHTGMPGQGGHTSKGVVLETIVLGDRGGDSLRARVKVAGVEVS